MMKTMRYMNYSIRWLCLIALMLPLAVPMRGQNGSPIINADNTVTFTLFAPDAEEVYVKGSFSEKLFNIRTKVGAFGRDKKYKMKKDGGNWTFTTQPLQSELYTYYYVVNDKDSIDAANKCVVRDVDKYYNYFIVPGTPGSLYMKQNVPHGKIEKVWYPSNLNNMKQRRMTIYLPAEYDKNSATRYPVAYLLHGSGGDENAWVEAGAAAEIMDNMLAKGEAVPMIVVMPNGIENLDAAPGESPYMKANPSAMNVSSMFGKIEKVFVPEIVDYVDSHYRTIAKKSSRAIAGLSLGGLQTIYISANNPDKFDFVGLFSAQTTNMLQDNNIGTVKSLINKFTQIKDAFSGNSESSDRNTENISIYADFDNKLKKQFAVKPKLYYVAVGKDDFVKKLNDDYRAKLDALGCEYVYNETEGAHTWNNWRRYLLDFLPKLFK